MELLVEHAQVWAAALQDKPGAMAGKLTTLAEAGADLGFIIARRAPDKPGTGVVFVTPLRGDHDIEAAVNEGFRVSGSLHAVRVEGDNRPGIAAEVARHLATAGLNLRGASAAAIGNRSVMHFAFDTNEDAQEAMRVLQEQS